MQLKNTIFLWSSGVKARLNDDLFVFAPATPESPGKLKLHSNNF